MQTITPALVLPVLAVATTIDGTTQPGYAGTPLIVLDGNFGDFDGLVINAFFTGNSNNTSAVKGAVHHSKQGERRDGAQRSEQNPFRSGCRGRIPLQGNRVLFNAIFLREYRPRARSGGAFDPATITAVHDTAFIDEKDIDLILNNQSPSTPLRIFVVRREFDVTYDAVDLHRRVRRTQRKWLLPNARALLRSPDRTFPLARLSWRDPARLCRRLDQVRRGFEYLVEHAVNSPEIVAAHEQTMRENFAAHYAGVLPSMTDGDSPPPKADKVRRAGSDAGATLAYGFGVKTLKRQSIKVPTGVMSGSFLDSGKTRKLNGVIFQKQNLGSGFFSATKGKLPLLS